MKTKLKQLGLIFCIFLIIIAQTGCKNDSSKELKEVNKEIVALDTMCSIKVFTEDEDEGKKIVDAAIDKLQELDEEFSKTNKKSEVYKLNHAGGKRIEVSDKFAKVIKKSIELSKVTGGRFDVTVGALTSLWDFTSGKNKVPSKAEIDKAKSTVGYKNIELKQNTCRLLNKDTQIYLGCIAKVYIGDAIKEYLQSKGIKNAIINLGGDVLTMGKKSSGEPYKVGIKKPFKGKQEILGYTEVQEGTVVTSGVYERSFKSKGKLYHHIINPFTGMPAETDLDFVTVKSAKGSAMVADALATSLIILGEKATHDKGSEIIKKSDSVDYGFLTYTKAGKYKQTDGFGYKNSEN